MKTSTKVYSVRVPDDLSEELESSVRDGRYLNTAEFIREAIRAKVNQNKEEA